MSKIIILGWADGGTVPDAPGYLRAIQLDPANPYVPKVILTQNPDDAKTWSSTGEAFAYWTKVHPTVERRPDGKPNKPMTAFNVEITEQ